MMKGLGKSSIVAAVILFLVTLGIIYWAETLEWVALPIEMALGGSLLVLGSVAQAVPLFRVNGGFALGFVAWSGMVCAVLVGSFLFDLKDPVEVYRARENLKGQYQESVFPEVDGVKLGDSREKAEKLLGQAHLFEKRVFELLAEPQQTEILSITLYKAVYQVDGKITRVLYNPFDKVVYIEGHDLAQSGKVLLQAGNSWTRASHLFHPKTEAKPTGSPVGTLNFERTNPEHLVRLTGRKNIEGITVASPTLDKRLRNWEPILTCDDVHLGQTKDSILSKSSQPPTDPPDFKQPEERKSLQNRCLLWDKSAVLLEGGKAKVVRGQRLEMEGTVVLSVVDVFRVPDGFDDYKPNDQETLQLALIGMGIPDEHYLSGFGRTVLVRVSNEDDTIQEINLGESLNGLDSQAEELDSLIRQIDLESTLHRMF